MYKYTFWIFNYDSAISHDLLLYKERPDINSLLDVSEPSAAAYLGVICL